MMKHQRPVMQLEKVKRGLTSFGATGRCVLLSSSLSTNMYLQRRREVMTVVDCCVHSGITTVSLTSQGCSPLVSGLPLRKCSSPGLPEHRGRRKYKLLKLTKPQRVGLGHLRAAGTHIKRRRAELDVTLNDEAHSFLHVTFGNGQGAAGLGQAAFGEHLQQVLLLVLPPRCWFLDGNNTRLVTRRVQVIFKVLIVIWKMRM